MRIGVSALLYNLDEVLRICRENELINHIEIGVDSLNDCMELKKYKNRLEEINKLKSDGLSLGIHLPMEINPCEEITYIRNSWINIIIEFSEALSFLEISYYNMHLGHAISSKLEKVRDRYRENATKFFKKILEENKDLTLTIENTYTKGGDLSNFGTRVEDFNYIFEKIKKSMESKASDKVRYFQQNKLLENLKNNLGFCYDNGHDLISESDYYLLSEITKVVHLSDNNKIEDEHLGIGRGSLRNRDLKKILLLEPEYLVMEIQLDQIEETLAKLKGLLQNIYS